VTVLAQIALPLSHYLWQGVTTISHTFHQFACCLQPAIGEEAHPPTSQVFCLPCFRRAQDFTSTCSSSSSSSSTSTDSPETAVTCSAKTRSISDYLRASPPLNSVPLALLPSYLYYTSGCTSGCLLGAVCITFFWTSIMLPVSHYLWQACNTFFISSLGACIKWLEKNSNPLSIYMYGISRCCFYVRPCRQCCLVAAVQLVSSAIRIAVASCC
jgi:hypothetical protein